LDLKYEVFFISVSIKPDSGQDSECQQI